LKENWNITRDFLGTTEQPLKPNKVHETTILTNFARKSQHGGKQPLYLGKHLSPPPK